MVASPQAVNAAAAAAANLSAALDQGSERMSSDVSDDATRDDASSPNDATGNSNGGGGGAWDDSGSGSGSAAAGRRKRMRSSFKHHQLKIMKFYFQTNHNPDAKELREISLKTGLMTRVIQVGCTSTKRKGSSYSTAERRAPELIPVLGSQPAGDVSHKPGGRLLLLSTRPAVTLAILKRAATDFAAW